MKTYKCMNELIKDKLLDINSNWVTNIVNADPEDISILFRYWLVECDYPIYELLEHIKESNILIDFKYKFGFDPIIEEEYLKYYKGYSEEMALGAFTSSVIEAIIDYPGNLYRKLNVDFVNIFMDEMQIILDDIENSGYSPEPDLDLLSWQQENYEYNRLGA